MNARASRRRRKELNRARRRWRVAQPENPQDMVVRLRQVRDARLADNGRRRTDDLRAIDAYYAAERREIWAGFHGILAAIREGKRSSSPRRRSKSRRRRSGRVWRDGSAGPRVEIVGQRGPEAVEVA